MSPNADARPAGQAIDTLILHYTGMRSAAAALERLCDPEAKVSAHYLIDEDGSVTTLVAEEARAWHAGISAWRGASGMNDRSIGIELVNPGHEWGYRPFHEAQYQSCITLCAAILSRWPIPQRRVLGHSDVAPDRKEDPGELFDWERLARAGIGLWPEPGLGDPRDVATLQAQLALVGYAVPGHGRLDSATRSVIRAFQRHFRPTLVNGTADQETLARLDGMLAVV